MKSLSFVPLFAALLVLGVAPLASAATMSFGGSRTFDVGDTFAIPVQVSTAAGESMNAVAATVRFPQAKLRVVSVADNGIIDLWAEKPAYSNAEGTVTFQGIAYNPGFAGTNGRVLTVTFRALAAGEATLSFSNASVLANDGNGTEILTSSRAATLTVDAAPQKAPAVEPARPSESEPSDEPIDASTTPPLLDVSAEHAPEAVATDHVITFKIPYGFLLNLRAHLVEFTPLIVIAVGLAGWAFFALWLLWHRMHRVRRTLLARIAATDTDLHGELLELHNAIEDEVKRLKSKDTHRTLTVEEKHILTRFSTLLEHMEQVKTWHLKLPRRRR